MMKWVPFHGIYLWPISAISNDGFLKKCVCQEHTLPYYAIQFYFLKNVKHIINTLLPKAKQDNTFVSCNIGLQNRVGR